MLLKIESLTAVVIYFLHVIQCYFFAYTYSVKQAPQNLWLQGWTIMGIYIIYRQKVQVICYFRDLANYLALPFC